MFGELGNRAGNDQVQLLLHDLLEFRGRRAQVDADGVGLRVGVARGLEVQVVVLWLGEVGGCPGGVGGFAGFLFVDPIVCPVIPHGIFDWVLVRHDRQRRAKLGTDSVETSLRDIAVRRQYDF